MARGRRNRAISPQIVSLRAMDDGVPQTPEYARSVAEARSKARSTTSPAAVAREHLLFRVEPRLSYVSDDFAQGNTEFWRK